MGGWAIGYTVGVAVVAVVLLVLTLMVIGARRTLRNAESILEGLGETRENTRALWAIGETNHTAARIIEGAVTARHALEQEADR